MSVFQIIALLLTLSALFSYLNYCFIKLPTTVGVMLIALIASLVLLPLQFSGNVEFSALRRCAAHQSQRPSGTKMVITVLAFGDTLFHVCRLSIL